MANALDEGLLCRSAERGAAEQTRRNPGDFTGTRPLPAPWTSTADRATGRSGQRQQRSPHPLKLKQTDAKILQAIEEALVRMERARTASAATAASPSRRAARSDSLDARLHHLQTEAELVKPCPSRPLLRSSTSDKLDAPAAARRGGAQVVASTTQQHVPVHHHPRGRASVRGSRPRWPSSAARRTTSPSPRCRASARTKASLPL